MKPSDRPSFKQIRVLLDEIIGERSSKSVTMSTQTSPLYAGVNTSGYSFSPDTPQSAKEIEETYGKTPSGSSRDLPKFKLQSQRPPSDIEGNYQESEIEGTYQAALPTNKSSSNSTPASNVDSDS